MAKTNKGMAKMIKRYDQKIFPIIEDKKYLKKLFNLQMIFIDYRAAYYAKNYINKSKNCSDQK